MTSIDDIAKNIETELCSSGISEKKTYMNPENKEYYVLTTLNALNKENVFIIVSGHPEIAGVWSNTLLSQGRLDESSMESYFKTFHEEGWGLIALNPHLLEDDLVGTTYISQIETILKDIKSEAKIGFIGFSMGPRVIYDFIRNNEDLFDKIIAIAQIDPVIQSVNWDMELIKKLEAKTILFASSTDQYRFGLVASMLLSMENTPIKGIHGALPNRCLSQIIEFFKSKL